MKPILVVAYGKNMEIGKNGDLPGWRLPSDMKHFRELTTGSDPVVMGRKTFESIPEKFRPLIGRKNFIISRNPSYDPYPNNPNVEIFYKFEDVVGLIDIVLGHKKVFITGGGDIYKEIIKWFDDKRFSFEIIATEVNGEFPEADTFFPKIDLSTWKKEILGDYKKGPIELDSKKENSHDFKIVRYFN